MYCTGCGKKVEEGMLFCTGCGKRLVYEEVEMPEKVDVPEEPKKIKEPKKPVSPRVIGMIVLAICLVVVVGACSVFAYNKFIKQNDRIEDDKDKDDNNDEDAGVDEQELVEIDEPAEEIPAETASSDDEPAPEEVEAEDTDAWCDAYAEYLREANDKGELDGYPHFGFLYVNDDDIPEIAIMGDCEASGNRFLTYSDDGIDEVFFGRLGFSFQEKRNIIINSDGHSGYYYDIVYEIDENGKWKMIADGSYSDYPDAAGDGSAYSMIYSWDSRDITEEEYHDQFNKYYDADTSKSFDTYENSYPDYGEMIHMLETRDITMSPTSTRYFTDDTAIHRYELVVDDVSWWQARSACSDKGGYLARINSLEEYDYIVEQIKNEGLDKMIFWLSGERAYPDYTYRWINSDYKYERADLSTEPGLSSLWMDGEPSGRGETADGRIVDETYIDMFYLKSEDRFVFNDVPEDLIDAAPSYKGRIAYIIEYE